MANAVDAVGSCAIIAPLDQPFACNPFVRQFDLEDGEDLGGLDWTAETPLLDQKDQGATMSDFM